MFYNHISPHILISYTFTSAYSVSLLLLKIKHSFFQESLDNNKSLGVTIYRCQVQAIIKERKTFEVFKLIYFKKLPIKKVLIKLRVLSDASVLSKCWFYEQALQKVLIELSPGVIKVCLIYPFLFPNIFFLPTVAKWLKWMESAYYSRSWWIKKNIL